MEEKKSLYEGDVAPDFTFTGSDNQSLRLSNFLGKEVVLYFYPRNFTPGCTTEASEFVEDYDKYIENDIVIIGVSPDNEKSHSEFRHHMKIPFFLASDSDKDISQKYGDHFVLAVLVAWLAWAKGALRRCEDCALRQYSPRS